MAVSSIVLTVCSADHLGKTYVQDLIWDHRAELAPLILDKRAYIYICGDAKSMSKAVEDRLMRLLAEAKGGSPEVEGAKELKLLKERNVGATHSFCVMSVADRVVEVNDRCLELGIDGFTMHIILLLSRYYASTPEWRPMFDKGGETRLNKGHTDFMY
jgi:hypothetical protein